MNRRSQRAGESTGRLYSAFVVRCWREGEQWRFLLENVATRERQGFDNFKALAATLRVVLMDAQASDVDNRGK
jgi:hypothetical protein